MDGVLLQDTVAHQPLNLFHDLVDSIGGITDLLLVELLLLNTLLLCSQLLLTASLRSSLLGER